MRSNNLKHQIRNCTLCADNLPLQPNPIVQLSSAARIQIIGQAPGLATHKLNLPFKDKSGDRLREWLAVSEADFYDETKLAITPMAFCYPGKNKSGSGDAPPPKICFNTWHQAISTYLPNIKMRILIGSYAAKAYLQNYQTLETAIQQKVNHPTVVLPHPSPRNNIWLKKNAWFEKDILPEIKERVATILSDAKS